MAGDKSAKIVFRDSDDEGQSSENELEHRSISSSLDTRSTIPDSEEDSDSDSDAAPEAISTTGASDAAKEIAKQSRQQAQEKAAQLKRKRQERDALYKKQAEQRKEKEAETKKPAPVDSLAEQASPEQTPSTTIPALLPEAFLTDESDAEDSLSEDEAKLANDFHNRRQSKKQRRTAASSVQDTKIGSTIVRVVKKDGKDDTLLTPKASQTSKDLRRQLRLRGRKSQPVRKSFFK